MKPTTQRSHAIQTIRDELERGHWCAIIAPRYSGKTLLAEQLASTLKRESKWKVANVRFQEADTLDAAWQQIATKLFSKDSPRHTTIVENILSQITHRDLDHCLILDDLDVLPGEVLRRLAAELRRLFNALRYKSSTFRFRCVLFGATELHYLTSGPSSPLWNVVSILRLADLTSIEATALLAKLLNCPSLDEECSVSLYEETAGHPRLVEFVAAELAKLRKPVDATAIRAAAEAWVPWEFASGDKCFAQATKVLRERRMAFSAVTQLSATGAPIIVAPPMEADALMCGAVTLEDDRLRFRGRMFQRAIDRYFDPLRRADHWVIHGDWSNAEELYRELRPSDIRNRRQKSVHEASLRILDLFGGIIPSAMELRHQSDAQAFVAKAAHFFFGSDRAVVWRLDKEGQPAREQASYPMTSEEPCIVPIIEVVTSAAKNHTSFTLSNNRGIVYGIGDSPLQTRWALELQFTDGIPAGEWLGTALRHAEPSIFSILENARIAEADERRRLEQRKLVHELNLKMLRCATLEDVFQALMDGICIRLGYECAQLNLVFEEENLIRAIVSNGAFKAIKDLSVRDLMGDDILALVYRDRKARVVPDCEDPRFNCEPTTILISKLKSLVVLVLFDEHRVVGLLQVGSTLQKKLFSHADINLLQPLADCAAVAIQVASEREAFELGFSSAGDAVAIIGPTGTIRSCNALYREVFHTAPGDDTSLTSIVKEGGSDPLVRLSASRKSPVRTLRQISGKEYDVTAVCLNDAFGRFAGGIEVVSTTSPLQGLNAALSEMLRISDENHLGQAIVDCVAKHFNYPRARLYSSDPSACILVSRWSHGLDRHRAANFATRNLRLVRGGSEEFTAGFECFREREPLVLVRAAFTEDAHLPIHQLVNDSRGRRIYQLNENEIVFQDELDKNSVREWLDVPLITEGKALGKLTIDLKGTERRFEFEDAEKLGLFGKWAADAFARVRAIERAKSEPIMTRDLRQLADQQGLEALAWDFLLDITLEGQLGFNRAVLFLRHFQSGYLQGFYAHGAGSGYEWQAILEKIKLTGDRQLFIDEARRQRLAQGGPNPEERKRLNALRQMRIIELIREDPFARVSMGAQSFHTDTTHMLFRELYSALCWEPARQALLCPLRHEGECEGVLYVDKAFDGKPITLDYRESLEARGADFVAVARPLRLGSQLRAQVLGMSHKLISPMSSVPPLVESAQQTTDEAAKQKYLNIAKAEAQRAVNIARHLLRASANPDRFLRPALQRVDLVPLLRVSVEPYFVLLEADRYKPVLNLPDASIWILADATLLGEAFAELADNAITALKISDESRVQARFEVTCKTNDSGTQCSIAFINSGHPIPETIRLHLFEQFVSGTGSTGLGLSLVYETITLHNGSIAYSVTVDGHSCFLISVPIDTTL